MKKLVVATRNPHKVRELSELLAGEGVELVSLADFPGAPAVAETGEDFRENAVSKALAAARHTGLTALADDSGLEVDALDGAPGVRSARFAGPEATDAANNRKLLELLAGVPREGRRARFRCVLALADPDGTVETVEGRCEGRIAEAPRGQGGFGYDPLFEEPQTGLTFAEMDSRTKHRYSHRARAAEALKPLLRARWRDG